MDVQVDAEERYHLGGLGHTTLTGDQWEARKTSAAVIVKIANMEIIGFVTQEDPQRLPEAFRDRDCVLVYLPMRYMIGGYTLLVPSSDVRPCKMSMDEAMRFALTAGITGKDSESQAPRAENA